MKVDWDRISNSERFLAALQILHTCLRCGRCCSGKMAGMAMNSADVARMAKKLGIGKTEFMREYTDPSPRLATDRWLKRKECTRECVFLTPNGCSQYEGRGQVCRLYPYTALPLLEDAKKNKPLALFAECPGMPNAYKTVLLAADNMPADAAAIILRSDLGKYCALAMIDNMHGSESARFAARDLGLSDIPEPNVLYNMALAFATAFCKQLPPETRRAILDELENK